ASSRAARAPRWPSSRSAPSALGTAASIGCTPCLPTTPLSPRAPRPRAAPSPRTSRRARRASPAATPGWPRPSRTSARRTVSAAGTARARSSSRSANGGWTRAGGAAAGIEHRVRASSSDLRRPLERRPRLEPRQVALQVRVLVGQHTERPRREEPVRHHDVGRGELGPQKIVLSPEGAFDDAERRRRPHARIGKDRGDALRLGQEDHVTHEVAEGRHHRRLCEVEPLKEHAPLKRAGRGREAASTVALEDVLDDRARLEHRELPVLEHGDLAHGRPLREGPRGWGEIDGRDLVGDTQLLEEPEDAQRSGRGSVVEPDHRPRSTSPVTARVVVPPPAPYAGPEAWHQNGGALGPGGLRRSVSPVTTLVAAVRPRSPAPQTRAPPGMGRDFRVIPPCRKAS